MFKVIKTFARLVFLLIPPVVLAILLSIFGSPVPLLHTIGAWMPKWGLWVGVGVWTLSLLKLFKDSPDTIDSLGRLFWLGVLGFSLWHAWKGFEANQNKPKTISAFVGNRMKQLGKELKDEVKSIQSKLPKESLITDQADQVKR